MRFSIAKIQQFVVNPKLKNILPVVIYGFFGTFLIKNNITPFFFAGRGFPGRSLIIRVSLFFFYFFVLSIVFYLIQKFYKKLVSEKKPSNVDEKLDLSSRTFIVALTTLTLGVLIIFFCNNLFARIDTDKWKLNGLDIIPVELPIGNDFRVGLYQPAANLLKSGLKTIGPDGTYPSYYPPLVNFVSLIYLLFNNQTAYMVHTVLLFILNIFVLLIASLLVKEIILENEIRDQFTRTIVSVLLFIIMSFFNFSSYGFLFSIERGNVDIVAMFFILLSVWTLIKHPKNIWLQVIFLSIATHYKIYPAILFLILLYQHGKKLLIPMIVVNLAFLFVMGPQTAWSFILSLTNIDSGAGNGVNWNWVGNHSAFSFAENVTLIYPHFSRYLYGIIIVSLVIPLLIWFLGTFTILRNKFTPLNAILLLLITLPLMDLLPTISNDYRLIIQSTTILIFIGLNLSQILKKPSGGQIIELLLTLNIMFLIARPYDALNPFSYYLKENSSFFINNKYLWCLALETIMVWNVLSHHKQNSILPKQA